MTNRRHGSPRKWTSLWGGVAAALALSAGAAAAPAEDVAQFHGGPARTGVFAGPGPHGFYKLLWRYDTGHMVVSSPVVAGGVLYVGSKNGRLYALDAATGALKWSFAADAAITSTPAVMSGAAFFESAANTVYAVDIATGRQLWRRATGPDLPFHALAGSDSVQQWDYWSSSPLAYRGRVYVGSGDGGIYAFEARSGKPLWTYATAGRVRSSPATDGLALYAGSFDGHLVALDLATGKLRWSFKCLGAPYFPVGEIVASPAVADGRVFFGSRDFNLYALDSASGKEVWHVTVKNSWVPTTPAIGGDHLVFAGSADGRSVFAFDAATGKQAWSNPLDNNLVFSSPVVAGEVVFAATTGGTLMGLRAKDGAVNGYTLTQDRVMSTPWVEGDVLYYGDNDGFIYAMTSGGKGP